MSDLLAVAYPDRETAETVRRTLGQLAVEHVIELDDAVVVTRDEKGKVKLHQALFMNELGQKLVPGKLAPLPDLPPPGPHRRRNSIPVQRYRSSKPAECAIDGRWKLVPLALGLTALAAVVLETMDEPKRYPRGYPPCCQRMPTIRSSS